MNLLVTYDADADQRAIIDEGLCGVYKVSYLTDVADRAQALRDADVILSWNPPREIAADEYPLLSRLRLMQLFSAGGDHVPSELFTRDFDIAGNVGAYARPMAEHVLALTLALAKDLKGNYLKLKAGEFDQFSMNRSIEGSTVAILGFGGIGKAAAHLFQAFGARILGINTSGRTEEKVDFIGTLADLETVLRQADIIVISLALSKVTEGLIGERELGWTKPDAILVNVARGEIIDERAFFEHLKTHPGFRAGIDAWWIEPFRHGEFEMTYPFLDLPNVIGTPHDSGMVPDALTHATKVAVANLKAYAGGERIKGLLQKDDYVEGK